MESSNEEFRELTLLENIESDPDVNQSTLATHLGVAVGTAVGVGGAEGRVLVAAGAMVGLGLVVAWATAVLGERPVVEVGRARVGTATPEPGSRPQAVRRIMIKSATRETVFFIGCDYSMVRPEWG